MSLATNISFDIIDRPRLQIQHNKYNPNGGTIRVKCFADSVLISPSVATVTVKQYGGGDCATPVINAPATISGGVVSYALAAGNCGVLPAYGEAYTPWCALWSITTPANGVLQFLQVFDVVLWPIYNVVSTADLQLHHPDLSDVLFTGSEADVLQTYIDQAQDDTYRRLEQAGNRPWLIVDGETMRRPTEHRALYLFFRARYKAKDDKWSLLAQDHKRSYDEWFASTKFIYDIQQAAPGITPNEMNRPLQEPFFRV